MHIFQNTYILIATLAIGVVILVSISIYFALRGINVANGQTGRSFTSISNLERQFKRMGKARTGLFCTNDSIIKSHFYTA